MPAPLSPPLRAEVVRLRVQEALSLKQIAARLDLAKSTVQYIVEGLKLPATTVKKLRRMRREAQAASTERLATARPFARAHYLDEAHRQAAALRARETSLRYLERELPIRAKLCARYAGEFWKEAFDGVVLKACNDAVVVDWALTKNAARKVPVRMAVVKSLLDKRRRVAFIPQKYLTSKTAERLRKLRVEVLPVEDLLD